MSLPTAYRVPGHEAELLAQDTWVLLIEAALYRFLWEQHPAHSQQVENLPVLERYDTPLPQPSDSDYIQPPSNIPASPMSTLLLEMEAPSILASDTG